MPMETIWRVVIEVGSPSGFNSLKKTIYELSVVRGEPGVQGADDGEDWRLHSLLPDAYCSFY